MKYTNEQIKQHLISWVMETHQRQIKYVIPFCLGFYGYITNQIWACITDLVNEGVLTWEV